MGVSHESASRIVHPASRTIADEFVRRLQEAGPSRLADVAGTSVTLLHALLAELRPTRDEFLAAIEFLTEVGHHTDARCQEWALLADVVGLASLMEDLNHQRPSGATPNTSTGPFYRADVPVLPFGADISRDGKGEPLLVEGRVQDLDGRGLSGALVEVWHANAKGLYENQDPDHQPEHNLRGRFRTDGQGRFRFASVKPGGTTLPTGGPVGRLAERLGLRLNRPAHIHFRVSAAGFQTLTTQIFDKADAAVRDDAIFGVKPGLMAEFHAHPAGAGSRRYGLDLILVLCPQSSEQPEQTGRI
ncbi:dioxygenase family protein [Aureimonas sp. D3]|uniref:dioxygenase family protein n=1 Tax=Aureimonas sp. D3 TaxID=1638164 RepID=UPI000782D7CC|nr:dioxygenase [Aureimonas sp. D3]